MRLAMLFMSCTIILRCGTNPIAPDESFRIIGYGIFGGALTPGARIIAAAPEWGEFRRTADLRGPSYDPGEAIPSVDFASEIVIVLMLGQKTTGGYLMRVDRVTRHGRAVTIEATEQTPCVAPQVLTAPFAVIALARTTTAAEVNWSREAQRGC